MSTKSNSKSKSKKVTALTKTMAEMKLEDAPQKRDVPQKNLLSPDAQRISKLMENCIARAKLALNLPAIIQWISESGIVIDEKFSGAIERHNRLAERIESRGEQQEDDGAWAQLKRDFKNAVRDLLRHIEAHPDVIPGWEAQPGNELGEAERTVIRGLEEYHGHMVERMLPSEEPEERLTRKEETELKRLIEKEEKMTAAIKELDAQIAEKARHLQELDLKAKANQEVMSALKDALHKPCLPVTNKPKAELCRILEEADRAKVHLNTLILEHKKEESRLMEKNQQKESQIEDMLQNFDKKMEEMTAKLEEKKKELERDEEELRQLEGPFAALKAEYDKVMERRRVAEEKRREELIELELKTKAAIIAQAWWRGYSTRKALKNKGKGKKPPKKGKGKNLKKKQ